jgi:hypothetical protein
LPPPRAIDAAAIIFRFTFSFSFFIDLRRRHAATARERCDHDA